LRAEIRKLGRTFLHAAELGFAHPISGEPLRFQSPLPAELQHLLDALLS
jgi:23S rRNA-/tRNA-specific pseudouridylate synthase